MDLRRDKWKSEPEMDQPPSDTNARRKQKRQARRFDKLEKRKDFQEIMDEVDDYAQHQW